MQRLSLTLVIGALSLSMSYANTLAYKAHYLGDVGSKRSFIAVSINNSGTVLGAYGDANDSRGVFLWSTGAGMNDIWRAGEFDHGKAINSCGDIAGDQDNSTGSPGCAVIRKSDGTLVNLPTLVDFPYMTTAASISDDGWVAGKSGSFAVIWKDDQILWHSDRLYSEATDINNNGEAIWNVWNQGLYESYCWNDGDSTPLKLLAGTNTSYANSINDDGLVVGTSGYHAVMWDKNGDVIDLSGSAPAYSQALGINNNGWVVGHTDWKATLWMQNCSVNLSDFVNGYDCVARDVNDKGWIVGYVNIPDSGMQAVVWEPVPEPSSVLALLCGLSGAGGLMVRRKCR